VSRYVPTALQRKIRQQFFDCCAYCRTKECLTATTFELEHILPVSKGGQTSEQNLCLACPTCNRHKAARKTATDPEKNEPAELFNPQQQSWLGHFTWNEEFTEIVPLTAVGRATCAALRMNRPELIRVRKMWVRLHEHPPRLN